MAAVTFTRTQLAVLAGFVVLGTALLLAVPSPYGEGIAVDSQTGAPMPGAWHRLQEARRSGDVVLVLAGLRTARLPDTPFVRNLTALLQRELAPLSLTPLARVPDGAAELAAALRAAAADGTGDPVERFFVDLPAGPDAVDARAAALARPRRGVRPAAGEFLSLCEEFQRRGRARAEWRWRVRTFAAFPDSAPAVDGLMRLCVAHGLLAEALAVAAASGADRSRDEAHQHLRAQLGAWLGRADVEIDALERLVGLGGRAADRGRLIELYTYTGAPDRALSHAMALVDDAGELAETESAANTALSAGYVDEGLEMLASAARRAADPTPWLRRVADQALFDLRVDRAAAELERIAAFDPAADDAALAALYRRTDQPERLADVLQRRLVREPGDTALWDQLIALRYALGQPAAARALEEQRATALADPSAFLLQLPPELRDRAAAARRQALSLALAGDADGTIVGDVLDGLRPFLQTKEFRQAAELLLIRHPDDPAAKPMRIELLDVGRTPVEAAQAAADLAATYPDDAELARLWIARAGWAGLPDAETEARRRLYALEPGDRENRHELAGLLAFTGHTDEAVRLWRALYAEEGIASAAVPSLVDGLFTLGHEAEALDLLQQLATDPAATVAQRMRAADELFYRRSYDRARTLYAAVLRDEPAEPSALLRLGQIHAWTNDPGTARGLFERRLAATDADAAVVRFHLGEALWATGEPARARALQAEALAEFEREPEPDFTTRSLIATMLSRLGRPVEAAEAYRQLVARDPRDVDLVLDYVDVAMAVGDLDTGAMLLAHAAVLEPDGARLLRLSAELEQRRGNLLAADRAFTRAIELHGPDASLFGDLGQLRYRIGDWQGALSNYERWLQLQSDNRTAQRLAGGLRDELAAKGILSGRSLAIGRDRVQEIALAAAVPDGDRLQWNVRAGQGHYRGVAAITGSTQPSADVGLLDFGLELRDGVGARFGVGLSAAPGAPGDLPLGAYAAAQFQSDAPFASLELQAFLHALWTEPAAAPGLGGRQSGVRAQAYAELPAGLWFGAAGAFDRLSIDPDVGPAVADVRLRGELTLGTRLVDGGIAVAPRFRMHNVPAAPSSPFPSLDADDDSDWLVSTWIALQGASLLGDTELPARLPIAEVDEQAFVAARVDHRLAPGLGASVAGNFGADLQKSGSIWGADVAMTWRPSRLCELTVAASRSSVLGRANKDQVSELRFEAVLRW